MLKVAAAFYPWQFVAQRVGGDLVSVANLTKPGAEPHDLELTPRQVASLASTNLVIYERGLQPAVDKAVDQQAKARAYDTTSTVALSTHSSLLAETGGKDDPLAGRDPHVWLDPILLRSIVDEVARRFTSLRPSEAARFHTNAAALDSELTALDADIRSGLKSCASRVVVTSHTAFGYFGDRYGLQQVGIAGLSPDAEPSTARIAEVARIVKAKKVSTVYYETLVSPSVAKAVAREAHAATSVLDPIEGITEGKDYLTVMRANLVALRAGQRCT